MENSPDLSNRQTCGGAILSDRHILTSASCVSDYFDAPSFSTFYVHLGDTILGNDKDVNYNKTVLVTNKYLHPDYDFPVNNIAILEMAEPVVLDKYPNIKPACLPSQDIDLSHCSCYGVLCVSTDAYSRWPGLRIIFECRVHIQ